MKINRYIFRFALTFIIFLCASAFAQDTLPQKKKYPPIFTGSTAYSAKDASDADSIEGATVPSKVLYGGRVFFHQVAHKVTALYEQKSGDSNLWEVRNLDYSGEVVQVFVRERKQDFYFSLATPSGKIYEGFAIESFTFIESPGEEPKLTGVILSPVEHKFKLIRLGFSDGLRIAFNDSGRSITIEESKKDAFLLKSRTKMLEHDTVGEADVMKLREKIQKKNKETKGR